MERPIRHSDSVIRLLYPKNEPDPFFIDASEKFQALFGVFGDAIFTDSFEP